jgi:para-aminobenzoate synthetase component 1
VLYSNPIPYVENAEEYFKALSQLPWACWLDSGGMSRYDILVAQPGMTLITRGNNTEIADATGTVTSTLDPFDLIREKIGRQIEGVPNIPFCGGALGYWGYDLARGLAKLPPRQNEEQLPEMAIGIYDWALLIDHQEKEARLVSRLQLPSTIALLPKILDRLLQRTKKPIKSFSVAGPINSNFTLNEYSTAYKKIKDYLHAGDCYQVNLAQCFTVEASGDAFEAYQSMRETTPAPYSAFLSFPDVQILSASPERFLQVTDGKIETKPIKGTRPRGLDAQSDELLKEDLRKNKKDQAENVMIVDLMRNDLSQSCETGSVKVNRLFEIESFSNVHHLVSTITGKLATGKDSIALLRDCFPGGSITGAPKIRAMEIIEKLEPQKRGIYCGSIGYIGWDGNMDTSIVIRTLIYSNGKMHFSVGGGIVADSDVNDEYQETLDKAAGMLELLGKYGGKI